MKTQTAKGRVKDKMGIQIVGGGEMGDRIRAYDWSQTSLGVITSWPGSLVTSVNLLLQSPVPIVMLWDVDGHMLYNDAYAVFAGARHPRLLGSKVVEGWPEVADFNRHVMKQGLAGKTLSYSDQQLTLYRNDVAEEVWMDLNYSPIIDESGKPKGVWAIVVETTQRILAEQRQQAAERELQAEQERLRSIFEQAPALIAVLRGPKHVFEMANPIYIQTVTPGKDIVGKPLLEALPELKGQGVVKVLNDVLRSGEPYVGEMTVQLDRRGDGVLEDAHFNLVYQPISSREDGKADGIFVHAVEITDQVISRVKAEELNAQLQAVFESLPDGLYIAVNDEITIMNQRGAEALGYHSPDDVPRKLKDLYEQLTIRYSRGKGRRLDLDESTLGNALRGKPTEHIGVEVDNPVTGKKQILRTAGAPIRNRKGEIIGAVAINNDLTELYTLQDKVQQETLQRKLLTQENEQLMKLNATKDEFIALTSHQLRTPATGVKQYVAMLLQGYAGPVTAEQEQFLERAYESNERQLQIIEDILRVAKVDMGKTALMRTRYDIVVLTQNVLDEQADRFAARNLRLKTAYPQKPIMVNIDAAQLHSAISNIVDNAIKYTPDERNISVAVRTRQHFAFVEVHDEGVGIAQPDIDKLFQKFSRIHNDRSIQVGGTGLGLYWTKQIVELHDGHISVRSALGKGTTFTIKIPLGS